MNVDKLMEILAIQTVSYDQFRMFARIIREIKSIKGCDFFVDNGNIYVTKGNSHRYPCIVAHMDTVHDISEDLTAVQIGQNIVGFNRASMRQAGIGGDDKVGVFIALECVRRFDDIKAVFFRDEETGCEGSYLANVSFFEDCNFILQCDRRGCQDFVIEASGIELSGPEFQSAVEPFLDAYRYRMVTGQMTDVMALKDLGVGCSAANISCGYFNPHTEEEFVHLACVEHCLGLVVALISHLGHRHFPHEVTRSQQPDEPYPFWNGRSLRYCIDCWGENPAANGYCDACNSYYELLIR